MICDTYLALELDLLIIIVRHIPFGKPCLAPAIGGKKRTNGQPLALVLDNGRRQMEQGGQVIRGINGGSLLSILY